MLGGSRTRSTARLERSLPLSKLTDVRHVGIVVLRMRRSGAYLSARELSGRVSVSGRVCRDNQHRLHRPEEVVRGRKQMAGDCW